MTMTMKNKTLLYKETPGKKNAIHFNNAGAALMPDCVLDAQQQHLSLEAEVGGYEAASIASNRVEAVYDSIAKLINCKRDEIAIVENATVGWMMAFYSIPFEEGDRILTAEAEYSSNYLAYLHLQKTKGIKVEVIPSNEYGEVCTQSLSDMIDNKVRLISITHVPTNGGLINPIVEIGKIAKENNILYLVDACQSVGQMSIDVKKLDVIFFL